VALAAQDTLANFFGYLAIITDAPFKVGHLIEIDGVEGFVEDISLRSTRLRQRDRSLSIIPNRTVADTKITNWSRLNSRQIKMVEELVALPSGVGGEIVQKRGAPLLVHRYSLWCCR
jgi:MscS family membrane protein